MRAALLLAAASCALGLVGATPAWCQRGGMPSPNRNGLPGSITQQIDQAINGMSTQNDFASGTTVSPAGSPQKWYDHVLIWEDDSVSVNGSIPANVANGSVVNNTGIAEATDLNGGQGVAGQPQPPPTTIGVKQPPFYGPQAPISTTSSDTSLNSMTDEELEDLISDDDADSADVYGGVESNALVSEDFPAALCGS